MKAFLVLAFLSVASAFKLNSARMSNAMRGSAVTGQDVIQGRIETYTNAWQIVEEKVESEMSSLASFFEENTGDNVYYTGNRQDFVRGFLTKSTSVILSRIF
mmetsp:Transcript_27727/g.69939  ORF Transcript_27727/g.69939 Transcript_27727/m.69939 type:complete len:102 (+) Transcript_27727:107-412(+)